MEGATPFPAFVALSSMACSVVDGFPAAPTVIVSFRLTYRAFVPAGNDWTPAPVQDVPDEPFVSR
ncbi:MAG: hypothetical protein ACREDR_17645, partial [Blastocatellia bacterium]